MKFIGNFLVNYVNINGDISPFLKFFCQGFISPFHATYFQDQRELPNIEKVISHYELVISTSSSFISTSVCFIFLQPFWKIC
jgi:hypothetical protein